MSVGSTYRACWLTLQSIKESRAVVGGGWGEAGEPFERRGESGRGEEAVEEGKRWKKWFVTTARGVSRCHCTPCRGCPQHTHSSSPPLAHCPLGPGMDPLQFWIPAFYAKSGKGAPLFSFVCRCHWTMDPGARHKKHPDPRLIKRRESEHGSVALSSC